MEGGMEDGREGEREGGSLFFSGGWLRRSLIASIKIPSSIFVSATSLRDKCNRRVKLKCIKRRVSRGALGGRIVSNCYAPSTSAGVELLARISFHFTTISKTPKPKQTPRLQSSQFQQSFCPPPTTPTPPCPHGIDANQSSAFNRSSKNKTDRQERERGGRGRRRRRRRRRRGEEEEEEEEEERKRADTISIETQSKE